MENVLYNPITRHESVCQPQVKKKKKKKKKKEDNNNNNKAPSFVGKCKSLKAATKLTWYNDGNRHRFKDAGRTGGHRQYMPSDSRKQTLNYHADQVYHNFDQSSALCLACKGMSGSVGVGVGWGGEGGSGGGVGRVGVGVGGYGRD